MVVCSSWDFLAEHGKVEHNATHNPKACPSWRKLGAVKSSFHHYTTFQPPPNGETSQLLPTPIPAPNMVLLHAHWYAAWLNYPREASGNLIIRFIVEEGRLPFNSVGKTQFVTVTCIIVSSNIIEKHNCSLSRKIIGNTTCMRIYQKTKQITEQLPHRIKVFERYFKWI